MYLNPLKYLHLFSNSSRWIVPLLLSFPILTVVRSRFHFLCYHIKYLLFPSPIGGSINTFSSLRYIPLNPFYEYKKYAKSVACHQFKLVKDTHNVILIIVSSNWSSFFFLELFIISHSRFHVFHLFFSGVPSFLGYIVAKLHLNHHKAHLVLSTSLSFYHPFYYQFFMEALHGGSTRIPFILQLFFKISLEVMTHQAIL